MMSFIDINNEWFWIVSLGIPAALLAWWAIVNQAREERAALQSPPAPPAPSAPIIVAPRPAPVAVTAVTYANGETPYHKLEIKDRGHTIIAARSGDGKSFATYSGVVFDLARQAQVILCNPQVSLYHPEDQPIDLRPIRGLIEYHSDPAAILAALKTLLSIIDQRNKLYEVGEPVGHHIVAYIDEWPTLVDADKSIADVVRAILRTGRKCNVWIVLATQDAQVETLGVKSGVRNQFKTVLVGNVEQATARALLGDVPRAKLQRGQWQTASGIISVKRPSEALITRLRDAYTDGAPYARIVQPAPTDDEPVIEVRTPVDQGDFIKAIAFVAATLATTTKPPSARALARHLYGGEGGGRDNAKAQAVLRKIEADGVIPAFHCSIVPEDAGTAQEQPKTGSGNGGTLEQTQEAANDGQDCK